MIALPTNLGFAAACNAGMAATRAPFVAIANPDVRLDPECLRHLMAAAKIATDGIAFAPVPSSDARMRRFSTLTGDVVGLTGLGQHRIFRHLTRDRPLPTNSPLVEVDYAEGAFLLLRRSVAVGLGGFDERFFLYSEEEELCRRARAAGCPTFLVPAARMQHLETSSSAGFVSSSAMPMRLRSRCLYFRMYRGRSYAFAARLTYTVIAVLHRALHRKRDLAYPEGTIRVIWSGAFAERYAANLGQAA
jgi:GT2 family glycosyltransferase